MRSEAHYRGMAGWYASIHVAEQRKSTAWGVKADIRALGTLAWELCSLRNLRRERRETELCAVPSIVPMGYTETLFDVISFCLRYDDNSCVSADELLVFADIAYAGQILQAEQKVRDDRDTLALQRRKLESRIVESALDEDMELHVLCSRSPQDAKTCPDDIISILFHIARYLSHCMTHGTIQESCNGRRRFLGNQLLDVVQVVEEEA